jgi:hypothetical protein
MLYSYTHFIIQAFPRQALNREPADTYYKHTDQLPSFNLSLLFSDELGYASYQRLLGVTFTDDGSVYSIQDMFSERTLVFLAEDFTELMPLTLSSLYQPHRKLLRTASHTRVLSPHETQPASRVCSLPPSILAGGHRQAHHWPGPSLGRRNAGIEC